MGPPSDLAYLDVIYLLFHFIIANHQGMREGKGRDTCCEEDRDVPG